MMVNILDPKFTVNDTGSGDELVDIFTSNFLGPSWYENYATFPQGASVFKDEEGNFDKDKMDEFMNKLYMENVWCFGKDTSVDLFRDVRVNTLEEFFA